MRRQVLKYLAAAIPAALMPGACSRRSSESSQIITPPGRTVDRHAIIMPAPGALAGAWYAHYYCVCDPLWRGSTGITVQRVEQVLRSFGLLRAPVQWIDAGAGRQRPLHERPTTGTWPADIVAVYPEVSPCASCESILGPSYYAETKPGDRYLYSMELVVGSSRRVHPGNEYFNVEIDPALVDYIDAAPVRSYAGTLRSSAKAPSSRVVALQSVPVPAGFTGLWSCALMLNCNKDLPAFVERSNEAPGTRFRAALEAAFGARLIEIGDLS